MDGRPRPHEQDRAYPAPRSPLQSRAPQPYPDRLPELNGHHSQPPHANGHGGAASSPPGPPPYSHPPPPAYGAPAESVGLPPAHQVKSPVPTPRASNPMSMSNLLSDSGPEPAPVASSPPRFESRKPSRSFDGPHPPPIQAEMPSAAPVQASRAPHYSPPRNRVDPVANGMPPKPAAPPARAPLPSASGPPELSVRATEAAYAEIEAQEASDVEGPGYEAQFDEWKSRSQKRVHEIDYKEASKRKRRRKGVMTKYQDMFRTSSDAAKEIFVFAHEKDAEDEVKSKDIEEEKERKKDMQRKRRRERTLQNETAKRDEAMERLQNLEDEEEKARLLRDVHKAGKKIKNTEDLLQGKTPSKDIRGDSPSGATTEGGAIASILPVEEVAEVKGRKVGKGSRPRKSKEQKLAEKENAAAGQAYLDRGDELPALASKDDVFTPAKSETREVPKPVVDVVPYSSKGYNQIYEQIWKDLAKNHVNKVYRIRNTSIDTKASNLRKTAQLAAKEARRWQARTNKSTKDVQARAKRSMREMLSFWKRNERDERDQRKMAERQELENARKAEADREAARQKRKLNFLISQTELYSHFIGKKVKTDEIEKSTDDVAASAQTTRDNPNAHTVTLPDSNAKIGTKVTNFEDLDFDAEDETALREAAMANAQNAVQEAQDRARAFNGEGQLQSQFDDGEMNFQNPTSLQSMDVTQPKMLTCQLKEYQLKGLNWLVNLYEQGINGILADEMGLGKTVQSISVMSYLAEVHNIWGPFLVIAPASTLHNWQQEIAKFVPNLKVLPYWGNAKDRKVLRKFWDRKHITYNKESSFHVLVTSYQLVVQDTAYFQKIKWQYMILDEAQAIKSSQSSRWKALLGFHCRNRLLLTGTPIQNNMQELWALLHFIMPSLFDSHDEFSDWFSKDIESHAQSNTKLNEDQLKRLHMILKPFMLRRVKKHVQKELGDKVEEDVFCDLTYRQRAYYTNLRNKISFMELIEKAAVGDDQDTATLMNLVMQFRKVCNHPDLFERADITSPMSMSTWAETASFMREGFNINVAYSVKSMIDYWIPKKLISGDGRLDLPGPDNEKAGWRRKNLRHLMSIWDSEHIRSSSSGQGAFSWLRFVDSSPGELSKMSNTTLAERLIDLRAQQRATDRADDLLDDEEKPFVPAHSMLNIVKPQTRKPLTEVSEGSNLQNLLNISRIATEETGYSVIESSAIPRASAPPIELVCPSQHSILEKENAFFNVPLRRALYPISTSTELALLKAKIPPSQYPVTNMLPAPDSERQRFTKIQVPSMRRFVSDCGKLAKLDELLRDLKANGHRVLLYFQMTRMIDLMEEYLTYRNYKYCRLDGSTKLEDRRDTVAAFQSNPEIFVFLLSTRAGGLGINLTSADTVIFYDSDWNPTIDSQAMDRAHRLGQTKQVTVYRLITRGTIEERIRKRALQKEEVQRVVISGGAPAGGEKIVDFNARSRDNRTKDIALWLADDEQAAAIEQKEAEMMEQEAKDPSRKRRREGKAGAGGRKKEVSMDDMYHEGEGKFDDDHSNKPSGAATPVGEAEGQPPAKRKKGTSKKAKTIAQRLAVADGQVG
ncbi:putative DNA helicase INO80 [Elsinoe australis]|uniref:Chromatin-remodeling ATPase INO80 n=1 Tax=Elsinoe australis TaxID=40998 RepID=A0A4U7B6S8_9PEZI|nr:putative DNA helicase INO80 [Elsinoe australis]